MEIPTNDDVGLDFELTAVKGLDERADIAPAVIGRLVPASVT